MNTKEQETPLLKLAEWMEKSELYREGLTRYQALIIVLAGRELGFGPAAAMSYMTITKNGPRPSTFALSAILKASNKYDFKITELTSKRCEIAFFENGELAGRSEFTIDEARNAGYTTGLNRENWAKTPRNMLFARALTNGARWYCADTMAGLHTLTAEAFELPTPEEIDAANAYHADEEPEAAELQSEGERSQEPAQPAEDEFAIAEEIASITVAMQCLNLNEAKQTEALARLRGCSLAEYQTARQKLEDKFAQQELEAWRAKAQDTVWAQEWSPEDISRYTKAKFDGLEFNALDVSQLREVVEQFAPADKNNDQLTRATHAK
jgi:hypothetical protein